MSSKKPKNFSPDGGASLRRQIGRRVQQIRRDMGLTQVEFGARLGRADNSAVSRLERGAVGQIGMDALAGLIVAAEATGRTAEWLLTGQIVSASAPPEEVIRVAGPLMVLELLRNPMAYSGPEADAKRWEQMRRVLGLYGLDGADKTGGE